MDDVFIVVIAIAVVFAVGGYLMVTGGRALGRLGDKHPRAVEAFGWLCLISAVLGAFGLLPDK